ncbi:hypothetical protein HPP92_000311 [Vanilla planifolia]|uniref:Pentatricopeptide repeat-containing protein n=1 Tax=Vanilla planifolia TaxID=51239 RepID=A0A835RNK8_VANPL|nr:hypothetical protein HPP92_000311 [Vanilla planifolia]
MQPINYLLEHKVFQRILEKDIISWNTMVASYAAANKFDEAFELFRHMLTREFESDEYTFSSVFHDNAICLIYEGNNIA